MQIDPILSISAFPGEPVTCGALPERRMFLVSGVRYFLIHLFGSGFAHQLLFQLEAVGALKAVGEDGIHVAAAFDICVPRPSIAPICWRSGCT